MRKEYMLGRIYQMISENVSKTANRIYPQRPHRDGLIRINTKVMQVLRAASTAPSACLRSLKQLKLHGQSGLFVVRGHLRKHFVNGKQMRMASVLKAGKYRKNSK